jgi:hypothetical protein
MDLSQEEINMVLEAGLEKVAYEEGLNDYADSLEKVANVHGVDAMELHDFLEETGQMEKAAEEENQGLSKKQLAALIGGGAGAGAGALTGKGTYDFIKNAPESIGNKAALGEALKNPGNMMARGGRSTLQALKNNKGKVGLGAAGLAALGGGAAYAKKKKDKEKTAAAYGLDEDTFDALFNAGVEALSE